MSRNSWLRKKIKISLWTDMVLNLFEGRIFVYDQEKMK